MVMGNNDEALRVLLQEGDHDLEQMVFADVTELPASNDNDPVITWEPAVLFSPKWVRMLFNVLSVVLKSRELNAILKMYTRSTDGRAVYLRVLEKLDTTCYGAVGRAVMLQELTTRSLVGRTNSAIIVDELQSLHMRYNHMSTEAMTAEVDTAGAIGAQESNLSQLRFRHSKALMTCGLKTLR